MRIRSIASAFLLTLILSSCGQNAQDVPVDLPDKLEMGMEASVPEEEPSVEEKADTYGAKASSGSAGSVLDAMASEFGQPSGGSEEEAGEYVLVDASEVEADTEYTLLPQGDKAQNQTEGKQDPVEEAPLGVQVENQQNGNAAQVGTKTGSNDDILHEILNDNSGSGTGGSAGSSGGSAVQNPSGGGGSNTAAPPQQQSQPSAPATGTGKRPSTPKVLAISAPGTNAVSGGASVLDMSNVSQGYVAVNYSGSVGNVRFKVTSPNGTSCTYVVSARGSYQAFPLTSGNGVYAFRVYEEVDGSGQYATINTGEANVALADSMLPYLYPNTYCSFTAGSSCVAKAAQLATPCDTDLQVVDAVYHYCVNNISYDDAKAATVPAGYAPTPDDTLNTGRGICFDYASLMTAMLRSQGIPTRLEVGYVGRLYHAWISCYIAGTGWIDGVIQFNGSGWTLMDPTTAHGSSSQHVQELQSSTGYAVKFLY